ncbi:MAG: hypothetical protein ACE1ZS_06235, partial [Candidatus Poribacteria bacterium]
STSMDKLMVYLNSSTFKSLQRIQSEIKQQLTEAKAAETQAVAGLQDVLVKDLTKDKQGIF